MDNYPQYARYVYDAAHRRGLLIDRTVILERQMDEYISHRFCSDEDARIDLLSLIISSRRMTAKDKVEVLLALLKKHDAEFYKTHTGIKTTFETILATRNMYAHQMLDTRTETVNAYDGNIITFLNLSNPNDFVTHSKKELEEVMEKITKLTNLLNMLNQSRKQQ
ncbi:MAG: hypothetical protein GTN67_05840 [Hydrotalea flava]|uniref:hypothetical protein n=1 Tax=Hydrotalea TaxID=1004300 RepID=UPI0010254FEE|nr:MULTISPECIES: hypothetical protein [Hydrotalea]NIM34957.1 hypothetical protein [Hydrotalea flava]NIM37783.1 hypothetical protein [Hydrotalea flava]NIN02952.1 hypothetical protein [Hydrotalea flava]NIN14637.1 hypothetical protein [Hydrotalea flava]NIO93709.1 hypothetical protein [Hydrotalea flava]